jgi:hypothetical protein
MPQTCNDLQRRLVRHLAMRPGFSTTDRLVSELFPRHTDGRYDGFGRLRYRELKTQTTSALRRLQAIGFVRYDDQYGGWIR